MHANVYVYILLIIKYMCLITRVDGISCSHNMHLRFALQCFQLIFVLWAIFELDTFSKASLDLVSEPVNQTFNCQIY